MSEKKTSNMTVPTLHTLYANSLFSNLDGHLLVLEGFYNQSNGRLYGKYFYDEILSRDKQNKITAQFTPVIRKKVELGGYYQFEGFVNRTQSLSNDSKLNILFTVTNIIEHEPKVQLISKVEYDIFQARFKRDVPLITDMLLEKIHSGRCPVLDVVTGVQSTSKDDYLSQLPDYDYYEINHHKCNLSSEIELLAFLKTHDFNNTDLLIILRGGGSGLEVFSEIDLCKKALELPVPFITGIGHDADKTLLEKIADRGFSTPTAVGTFLQNMVTTHKDRLKLVKVKEDELIAYKKQAESERDLMINQVKSQKRTLNLVLAALVALLVIVGVMIFKTFA